MLSDQALASGGVFSTYEDDVFSIWNGDSRYELRPGKDGRLEVTTIDNGRLVLHPRRRGLGIEAKKLRDLHLWPNMP